LADNLHDVMVEILPTMERGNIQAQISTKIENAITNVIPSQVDASVLNPELQQQDIAIWLALQMKFERNTVPQTACRASAVHLRDQDDPHDDAHLEESSSGQVSQKEQAPSTSRNQEQDDDFDFWIDSYASDDDEILMKQVSQDIMEEVSLTIDEAKLRKMADEMLRQRCTSGDEHQYHIDQMKNFLKNPEALVLSLINQDLLYLKKGNSRPEKIVLSLHKFPAVIFNDDDIKELFIRSSVIWERVHDFQHGIESYQQKVNLTAPIITFLGIKEHEIFSIIYEPVHGIIYKNSKKEKRVMRHSEIHKFYDATLNRVLEGLKSYNNDVKYGYISQAFDDESWVEAMQEELFQFKIQKVWTLVDLPSGKKAIGTKWVYRNKKDKRGIVVRNKARLMDVKSGFLYGTIEEEVYICQPLGFVDPEFPEKVNKMEKALNGLHQAPRAWYETLFTYLMDNGFHKRQIDKTFFIKRLKGDILLAQVYVDDIIFGSTKKSLCDEFEQIIHNRFQMSSMGALIFFLGLQVKQKEDGIFISQDKSWSMIGSLMYLISSRPDIMFSCKKQTMVANSTTEAEYIAASHYCGQNPVYHSKTKNIEIRHHFIRDSYEKRLIEMVKIHTDHNVADLLTKAFDVSRFNFLVASIGKRGRDTKIPQSGGPPIKVGDEAIHKELGDRMERAATTTSSLEVEQESGSTRFHQIVDFLNTTYIKYALTKNPTIYISFIHQFWETASATTNQDGEMEITATIDGRLKTVTEASI
ncbi:putative ribonuclease H-like domain-containing protein, partial [Tanacetum coccineum]